MLNEKGQTILEVVVVIAVVLIVAGALVFATVFSLRNSNFAKSQTQATKLAQEGLEKVRTQRDRNGPIRGLGGSDISWDDTILWTTRISGEACNDPCYFKLNKVGQVDGLVNIGAGNPTIPDNVERIPPGDFKRAIILSDDTSTYTSQKQVTAVVEWTDATGTHESRLSTVLRKI